MHPSHPSGSRLAQSDVTTDDLAFIAQFADVKEETTTPVPLSSFTSISSSSSATLHHAVSSKSTPTSEKTLKKEEDDDSMNSEDEIEHLLEGSRATIASRKTETVIGVKR